MKKQKKPASVLIDLASAGEVNYFSGDAWIADLTWRIRQGLLEKRAKMPQPPKRVVVSIEVR